MNVEYHRWWSPALKQDMEIKVYGHTGKPVIVFPSTAGRFYDFENYGMVEACAGFIRKGWIKLFTVDSVDAQSWLNTEIPPADRAARHDAYEKYILEEVIPFARHHGNWFGRMMGTGCSLGAFHAVNFLFRHPRMFDTVIGLSGIYGPRYLLGDYMDDHLYFYFPLAYLPGLEDPVYLDEYRKSRIILCVGQGAWEQCERYDCVGETRALKEVLRSRNIPCWADFWGTDVFHDWQWWRVQLPYFLARLNF